jgi:hypothetical protein
VPIWRFSQAGCCCIRVLGSPYPGSRMNGAPGHLSPASSGPDRPRRPGILLRRGINMRRRGCSIVTVCTTYISEERQRWQSGPSTRLGNRPNYLTTSSISGRYAHFTSSGGAKRCVHDCYSARLLHHVRSLSSIASRKYRAAARRLCLRSHRGWRAGRLRKRIACAPACAPACALLRATHLVARWLGR